MYVISAAIDAISPNMSIGQIPERKAQITPKKCKKETLLR
jgi:hypothetical protein